MHMIKLTTVLILGLLLTQDVLHARPDSQDEFRRLKYGVFVHYVWAGKTSLTVDKTGQPTNTVTVCVANTLGQSLQRRDPFALRVLSSNPLRTARAGAAAPSF